MLSVNESTVKRWIDRGLLPATRTPGGHRRVSAEDIQIFMNTQPAARRHSYVLARASQVCAPTDRAMRYYELHLAYRPTEARTHLVSAFIATGSVQGVLEEVVVPALVRIGTAWREGEIDIADEHRMTFLMRVDLQVLESFIPEPRATAPTALLACVPGDNHEFTLQMLSLLLKEYGWQRIILGINVPAGEVVRVVCERPVAQILLAKLYHVKGTLTYVREVRKHVPARIPILCGGSGWRESERYTLEREHGCRYISSIRALSEVITQ